MNRRLPLALAATGLFVVGCQSQPDAAASAPPAPPKDAAVAPTEPEPGPLGPVLQNAVIWLVTHQDDDGRWDADGFMKHDSAGTPCDGPGNGVHDIGATGLATLALLADGSTLRAGPYKDELKKATAWLVLQQENNGRIGMNAAHDFVYDHAIATFALCEAYGLSSADSLREPAQKALDYLELHRNPYAVWRYQPRDNDNDTSVTTWATLALCSGRGFGLDTNPAAFQCIASWYDQVTDASGRAGYSKAGEPSSRKQGIHAQCFPPQKGEAMTAAALFGRYLLGQSPKQKPVMAKSAAILAANPPRWEADRIDACYWYFGSFAAYQTGGETWTAWRTGLDAIAKAQRSDGNFTGSWDPVGVWDEDGGRVFATALYTLSLTSAHRYTKLVEPKGGAKKGG